MYKKQYVYKNKFLRPFLIVTDFISIKSTAFQLLIKYLKFPVDLSEAGRNKLYSSGFVLIPQKLKNLE